MYRNELANWILDLDEFFVIACRLWSLNSEGKTTFSWLERKRHDKILRFTDPKSPDSPVQNPEFKAKLPYCACDFGIRTWYCGISPPMFGCYTLSRQRFPMICPFEELGNTTFSTGRDALKAVAEPLGPWNWAFFTGGTELTVVAGGIGSVEEMRTCYEEHPEDAWYQWTMPWRNFSDFDKIGELYSKKNKPTVYIVFEPGLIWHDKSMYPKNE